MHAVKKIAFRSRPTTQSSNTNKNTIKQNTRKLKLNGYCILPFVASAIKILVIKEQWTTALKMLAVGHVF